MATRVAISKMVELATQVEADIRCKQLSPGDRYLSTVETARMLKVNTTTANGALQLLEKRKVLKRSQGIGTFVGQGIKYENRSPLLEHVHVVMNDPHMMEEGLFGRSFFLGLQGQLSDSHIGFEFMPEDLKEEKPYLEAMISKAMRSRPIEGFILVNSTALMQRLFRESDLPTVVFGSPYRSSDGMAYMDRDQQQIGRLIAEYLLSKDHEQILMVTRNRPEWGPGEYLVADVVGEVAEKAGLQAGALITRSLPHDGTTVRDEIRHVLEKSKRPPGILVRPWQMVDAVYEAIESVGLVPQQDVAVVVADYFDTSDVKLPYPVIRSEWTVEQQGGCLGQLLNQYSRDAQSDPVHRLVPVRLEVPESLRHANKTVPKDPHADPIAV